MRIMSYYNCGVQDRGPYNSLAYAVPEQQNKRPGCLWADEDQLSLAMKPVHWCAVYVKERSIIDHVVTTGVAVVLDPSCILLTRRRVASDGTPRLIISSLICRRKHRVLLRYHQYSLRYDDDDEVRQPNRKYNDKQSTHSSPECVRFSMAAIQNCIQDKHLV